ncbi:MAG: hypothetical protein KJ069_14810 [Anaerolineae bacterium]|nr:hypothetical protein [Anaerolineae bacterium]
MSNGRYDQVRELLQEATVYTQRMHIPYIAAGASRRLAELDQLAGRWPAVITHLQTKVEIGSVETQTVPGTGHTTWK